MGGPNLAQVSTNQFWVSEILGTKPLSTSYGEWTAYFVTRNRIFPGKRFQTNRNQWRKGSMGTGQAMCQCLNMQLKGLRMRSQVLYLMHVSRPDPQT